MEIKYSDLIVKARFLKGMVVKIVYIQFPKAKKLRVLISTDITIAISNQTSVYQRLENSTIARRKVA
jgi:hypothetical protein